MRAERYSGDAVREAAGAARELGYAHAKSEQLRVVEAFVQGRNVFTIPPTGYLRLSMAIFQGYGRLSCQMASSNYRWYRIYDYVITFLQYTTG